MSEFTAQQFATARAAAWQQNGEGLLTQEAASEWVQRYGLVLFAPKPQIAAPAPTFVEAVLGKATAAPSVDEVAQGRAMLARLVGGGEAVPLNLLGAVSDLPDYVASAKMFSFVFTLRGDKNWKQAPATAGAGKVSQLALGAYELLAGRGTMSTAELVHELGREVTEAAVLRALCELWGQLRMLQLGAGQWETAAKRWTKQIKAGTNAGQPTALSALISLYLAQAIAASEDEVEAFMSPLAARSRIREVVRALTGARELESVVLEGKTLLHVAGELPEFVVPVEIVPVEEALAVAGVRTAAGDAAETELELARAAEDAAAEVAVETPVVAATQPRIRKFAPTGVRQERERRPFNRGEKRPSFDKPWEEEKRPAAAADGGEVKTPRFLKKEDGGWVPARKFGEKPRFGGKTFGDRPPRKAFGDGEGRPERKSFGDRPPRKPFGDRPKFGDKLSFGDRPPRKTFGESEGRPPRKSFGDRPKFGDKPKFGDRPPRKTFGEGEGRPPRKSFGDRAKFGGKPFGDRPSRKPFGDRPKFGDKPSFGDRPPRKTFGEGEGRPPRKSFGDRPKFGDKPSFGDRPPRKSFGDGPRFGAKPIGDRSPRKSFGDKPFGDRPRKSFGDKPKFGERPARKAFGDRPPRKSFGDSEGFKPRRKLEDGGERKPFRKFDAPEGAAATGEGGEKSFKRPFKAGGKSFGKPGGFKKSFGDKPGGFKKSFGDKPGGFKKKFGDKPAGKFGGKKFGDKKFGGKPAGKFGGPKGPRKSEGA